MHCAHINFDSRHFGNRYCNHYSLKRKKAKNEIENKEKVGHFHDFFCFLMTFQLTSQITNNVIVRDNGFFLRNFVSYYTNLLTIKVFYYYIFADYFFHQVREALMRAPNVNFRNSSVMIYGFP